MSNPSGRNLLLLIKSRGRSGAPCLSLPVGIPVAAVRRPVATKLDAQNGQDVLHLTEWRNNHVESFLTEFLATPSQTRRWLAKTVGPSDSRILFMLDRLDGKSVGYMGLAFIDWASGYAEADAVVRGCPAQPLDGRGAANHALLGRVATFTAEVRSQGPLRQPCHRVL